MVDKAMLLDAGSHGPGLSGKQRDGVGQWHARLAGLFPEALGPKATDTIRSRSQRLAVSATVQVLVVGVAAVLACLLGFGWVTDFRYAAQRGHDGHWLPSAQGLVTACTQDPAGDVAIKAWGGHHYTVPCTRIRR